ncbi:MARCKS-related protein [Hyla sarda]|uniref:MARCKS-related protein n=1 Tax=Hyla sarda TaxID=327740 RepID=UPI0024C25EF3|nr:MARCKS-related protein [Hyla sarda]
MGSTESKSQSADTAASKTAEQQENGHVKANGDTLPKTNGDTAAANGSAEPVTEEAGSGETIEQAPPANGEAKPEEPPGKQAKKKRFSFKKNFKLPFRKTKKDAAAEEAPPAGEEAAATATPEQEEAAAPAADAKPVESTSDNAEPASPAEEPSPEAAAPVPAEEAAAPQPEEVVSPPEQTPQSEESVPSTEAPTEPQKEE